MFPKVLTISLQGLVAALSLSFPVFALSGRENDAAIPVVDLGYATYQGVLNATSGITRFLGIRFAAPPTGTLRWQPPQEPGFTSGVQLADVQPGGCMSAGQGNSPTTPFPRSEKRDILVQGPSEDCFFLNTPLTVSALQQKLTVLSVFTPRPKASRPLPVVVWIHPGGYIAGGASGFNGDDLIHEANGGVVVVIIQYRLGLFGFLSGSKVKAGGALNVGLLDQHFALQWVQKHISKFNGDPGHVAIWGQSAGAGSVLQHIVAQDGKTHPPLFELAISSSSFLPSQYHFDDPIPELLYSEVITQTGCATAPDSLACLRAVTTQSLGSANANISSSGFFGTFSFVPVVDGTFITQRPTLSLRQGKINGRALLAVTNTFEGSRFVNSSTAATVQTVNYISQLFPHLPAAQIQKAAALYAGVGAPIDQVIGVMGETIFICPTYFMLQAFKGRGFKGEFAIPPGGHADDVVYYWPSLATNGLAFPNPTFDVSFPAGFLNFAISGDPNVKTSEADVTPNWPRWDLVLPTGRHEMVFNKTVDNIPVIRVVETKGDLLERCAFWESVGEDIGQ